MSWNKDFWNYLNGYYNATPPRTFNGERKPHWSYEKTDPAGMVGTYWNNVPSRSWSGERKPHFSDELRERDQRYLESLKDLISNPSGSTRSDNLGVYYDDLNKPSP